MLRFLSQVRRCAEGHSGVKTMQMIIKVGVLCLQLLSFHVSSVNVMVLNVARSESLWHMTIAGITLLLDHQSKR